jgi:hypothetical protein
MLGLVMLVWCFGVHGRNTFRKTKYTHRHGMGYLVFEPSLCQVWKTFDLREDSSVVVEFQFNILRGRMRGCGGQVIGRTRPRLCAKEWRSEVSKFAWFGTNGVTVAFEWKVGIAKAIRKGIAKVKQRQSIFRRRKAKIQHRCYTFSS